MAEGTGGCVFTRRGILRRGIVEFFDKTSLIRLCDYLVSPLVASMEFLMECCP